MWKMKLHRKQEPNINKALPRCVPRVASRGRLEGSLILSASNPHPPSFHPRRRCHRFLHGGGGPGLQRRRGRPAVNAQDILEHGGERCGGAPACRADRRWGLPSEGDKMLQRGWRIERSCGRFPGSEADAHARPGLLWALRAMHNGHGCSVCEGIP
jgi:hypothetical protein